MAIILSWFISVMFLALVEARTRTKYVHNDPHVDLQLTLILDEEDLSVYWEYRCRPDERPYLVGPFPLIFSRAVSHFGLFGIDYGGTNVPRQIRTRCPSQNGIFRRDLRVLMFRSDDTVRTVLGAKLATFVKASRSSLTP
ncbi:hypothetical protein FOZ63_028956 [Perkinsus olseni]|uniref:Uncharacterized protein n=1 Tax=Perkinsus olseni TaxID=32597 RepID=A0A7J6QWS3_PEROL|nr:hypothetical protein FOZ60_016155 [Perkinsus olseni]KAF4712572.1 hypothetical protein FOZ63_028956 [Perkinsus olseni]